MSKDVVKVLKMINSVNEPMLDFRTNDDGTLVYNRVVVDTIKYVKYGIDWKDSNDRPENDLSSTDISAINMAIGNQLDWLTDVSLDGIHVRKNYDSASIVTSVRLYAYLTPADQSFWKLKYGNNS